MTLSDVLNKLSHKEIKALIRSYNLHTRIKLGQSKEALIEALNTHFNLNITDNKLIAKEYKVDIPTPAPIRATRRRPAPVELTEEEIKNKRIAEIENELNNIYSNLQAKDKETQAINDNLNKAIEEMKTRKAKKTLSKLLMEKVANLRKKKQDREIELLQQAQEQAKKEYITKRTPKKETQTQQEYIDENAKAFKQRIETFIEPKRTPKDKETQELYKRVEKRSADLKQAEKEYQDNLGYAEMNKRYQAEEDKKNKKNKKATEKPKAKENYDDLYKRVEKRTAEFKQTEKEYEDRLKNLLITSMDMRSKFKKDKAMDMRSKSKEDKEATEKAQQELQALRDAKKTRKQAEEIPETQILLKKADDLSKEYYSKLLIGKETEDIKNKYKDIQDKLNNLDVYTENLSTKEQFNKARKQEKNERKDRLKNLLITSMDMRSKFKKDKAMDMRSKSKEDKEATEKAQQELQALRDAKKTRKQAETKQTIPSKYLSGYIGINKKSNTFKYNIADEKKYKIKDEMFDIIDNKFTSSEVNKLVNNLNINASAVVDTARNFYDDKINAGKGVEYTDFVSLVIYPSLLKNTPKKSLTIEDKFILLLFANDIANEQFFSDVEPINKGSVAMQFLKPQTIGTKIGNYLGKEFQKLIKDLGMG